MVDDGSTNEKLNIIKSCAIFSSIEEKRLWEFSRAARICRFRKGEVILQEGEKPHYVYIIFSGKVKMFNITRSGHVVVLRYVKIKDSITDIIGLTCLFSGYDIRISAQAMEPVKALEYSREDFLLFVNKNPQLLAGLLTIMDRFLIRATDRLISMVDSTVEQRIIATLNNLFANFGTNLRFNQEEIATMAGTTRETTVKIMRQLKKRNIVQIHRGRIDITDISALQALI